LLYERERFASATALAILAIEEEGKYLMVKWALEEGVIANNLNDHIAKQVRFASLPFTDVTIREFIKLLYDMGFVVKAEPELTEQQRRWADGELGQNFRDWLRNDKSLREAVLERALETEDARLMTRAHKKELNRLKQRSIYVDLNDKLEVIADPADVSAEIACYFLSVARRFIGTSSGSA
jgi:AbiV family abortive infection protein